MCSRTQVASLFGVGAILSALVVFQVGRGDPPQNRPSAEIEIRALQKSRLAVLQQIAKRLSERFDTGAIRLSEVRSAKMAVHRAIVEMAETDDERIQAYRDMVESAERFFKLAKRLHAHDAESVFEVWEAEAQFLEAQIGLKKAMSNKR